VHNITETGKGAAASLLSAEERLATVGSGAAAPRAAVAKTCVNVRRFIWVSFDSILRLVCSYLAGTPQRLPIPFGLVCVERAEPAQRFGESVSRTKISGNHQRIPRTRMTSRQQLSAYFPKRNQARARKVLEFDGSPVIIE